MTDQDEFADQAAEVDVDPVDGLGEAPDVDDDDGDDELDEETE